MYEIFKIFDNVWAIEDNGVRCYLLEGDEESLLLDTGYGKGHLKELVSDLVTTPIKVVITHADRDHVGGITQFDNIYMHPADYARYADFEGADPSRLRPIWEGDIIDIGTFKFEIILIPGHTPGSIALLDRENRIMFGGDSVQPRIVMVKRNFEAYHYSMKKLDEYASLVDSIYSPHGEMKHVPSLISELVNASRAMLDGLIKGEEPEEPSHFGDVLIYSKDKITFIH